MTRVRAWGSVPAGLPPPLGCSHGTQRRVPPGEAAAGPGGRARGELRGLDTPSEMRALGERFGTIHTILPHRKWRIQLLTVVRPVSES